MEENGSFEGEIARESEPEESEMRSYLEGKYLPEILSRRGEFTAWVLLLVVLVGWIILIVSGRSVPFAVYILAGIIIPTQYFFLRQPHLWTGSFYHPF